MFGARDLPILKGTGKRVPRDQNCLFLAISPFLEIVNKEVRWSKKNQKQVSVKRGFQLRKLFMKWLLCEKELNAFPFSIYGFDSNSLMLLERFLKGNINIYSVKCPIALRINHDGILEPLERGGKTVFKKVFTIEVRSQMKYRKTVDLLSQNDHILSVVNIDRLCGTVCETCSKTLSEKDNKKRHKCEIKPNFLSEICVKMDTNLRFALSEYNSSWTLNKSPEFFLVNVKPLDQETISLEISEKRNDREIAVRTIKLQTARQCAIFLIEFIGQLSKDMLCKRLVDNIKLCASMQGRLDRLSITEEQYERHELCIEKRDLTVLQSQFKKYLMYVKCYLISPTENHSLVESIMISLLSELNRIYGQKCLKANFSRGQLSNLYCEGSSLDFSLANQLSNVWIGKKLIGQELYVFSQVIELYYKYFNLDFTLVNSLASMGGAILNQSLTSAEKLSFHSTSKSLNQDLAKMSRFGVISCKKAMIGADHEMKSAISCDITKFYLSVLRNLQVPTGIPLTYKKNYEGYFHTRPNRCRATYSNLLFSFINSILDENCSLYFALKGREIRAGLKSLPVDAFLYAKNGEKRTVSYLGCLHHTHFAQGNSSLIDPYNSNVKCHLNPSEFHKSTCHVCQNNDKVTGPFIPRLFRIKPEETIQSLHPLRKTQTYQQIYEESLSREFLSFGSELDGVVRIKECDIIEGWKLKIGHFAKKFQLPINKKWLNCIFGDKMRDHCCKNFPLMRYSGKISLKTLINFIKLKKVHGFLTFSGGFSQKGERILDTLKTFSYKEKKKCGKAFTVHSNRGIRMCVPTVLLHYLLNVKELKFRIYHIFSFTEYYLVERPLFKSSCEKVLKILHEEKDNKYFVSCLKMALNSAIGRWAYTNSNYPKTVIVRHNDYTSLASLSNLISSSLVDNDLALLHFRNRKVNFNLGHLNAWVLASGRKEMIHITIELKKWLSGSFLRYNTDGFTFGSKHIIDLSMYNNLTSLYFDFFLKSNLTYSDILSYVDFKMSIFRQLGFCISHRNDYIQSLMHKKLYDSRPCCLNYINYNTGPFILNIEFLADKGKFVSPNKYSLHNSVLHKTLIKCSGKPDLTLLDY